MEHKRNNNEDLVKIFFDLTSTDWKWSEESLWALPVQSTDVFKLDNIPLLVYGISQDDIFRAELNKEGVFYFKEVIERGGHSTFRINFKELPTEENLAEYLKSFNDTGCSYEGNGATLYAIDVPKNVDLQPVLAVLTKGETDGVWDYEEGFVFKG